MGKMPSFAISPRRQDNFPQWYQQVVKEAQMAENSDVRGCMVILPWGYALWENMKASLDKLFKKTGVKNAYFPMLIPLSYIEKEAEHVEGFAKECAVVTHHRLAKNPQGDGLVPEGPLHEPFIIRPTSETIIGASFSKWVKSYRDLPLCINQWANVMRWEMRPRVFLRTSEFLWQEGHTVHTSKEKAMERTELMLEVYRKFCHDFLALPVISGTKTPDERFPGAVETYTIEAIMQDGKALQCGTSHFLGQNFSKAQDIQYLDETGKHQHAWTTSWGVTTRLIGAMVMTHGDDNGMIMPPRVSPDQIVILPVYRDDAEKDLVLEECEKLQEDLLSPSITCFDESLRVSIDERPMRGGEKFWSQVKNGVPIIIELGPRDIKSNTLFVAQRRFEQDPKKNRQSYPREEFLKQVGSILESMQKELLLRAQDYQNQQIEDVNTFDELEEFFEADKKGLVRLRTDPNLEPELIEKMKKLKISARCRPLDADYILFGRAY